MARKTQEELNEIMKQEGVSRIWSYSRINCFANSSYEYYLRYLKHEREDRDDCIYGSLGGAAHQCLEDYYNGKITYEEMLSQFEDSWLTCYDIASLKFDRNDEEKNNKIAEKYHQDLTHFFVHHVPIKNKAVMERFVKIRIGDNLLQGYLDCTFKDDEGNFNIIDFKTSTEYKNKALIEHSAQLTLYGIGLMQLGVPMERIRIGFNFLKYAGVEVTQKNGSKKYRAIERYKLGESLCTNARMWLKDAGYDEIDIDDYLKMLIDTNNINVLPEEIQNKYTLSDHYVYIDFDQKLIDKWTNEITTTIRDIESREKDYEETGNDKVWWDSEESVKEQSYYLATLCGYSANKHLPYKKYLEDLETKKNGVDLFGGVGSNVNYMNAVETTKAVCDNKQDDDLSWLDALV